MLLSYQEPVLSPGQHRKAGDNKCIAKGFGVILEACGMWGTLSRKAPSWFWDTTLQPGMKTVHKAMRERHMCIHMHQISLLVLHCYPMQGFHAKYACPRYVCSGALENRSET